MSNRRQADAEAEVTFFLPEDGGKANAVRSGYRPGHQLLENYLTSGHHEYIDKDEVWPGETIVAKIWFITPEAYPGCLWIGREVRVHEGSRLVGHAKIIKVFNKLVERTD